ncbi:MAG: hypothetical protein K0Q99_2306 [Clostridia bacterium]|nr:hypothetical protein [Clostridia bacterium]
MTKYSIKNICLGIGIGLILGSIANISAAPKSLTPDEIRKEAAKHNLIVMDAKDLINKQPSEEKQNQGQNNQSEQQTPAPLEIQQKESIVTITIQSGSNSEDIGELLLTNNLIENKQSFLSRLKELKKESKMQVGTFHIPFGASIDTIIEIITSLPR